MGWISAVFVHKAVAAATYGAPGAPRLRQQLFAHAGVTDGGEPDAGDMVSSSRFFDLLERIAVETPQGRTVPLRMGAAMRCDDYGAFGLAFKSATDLLGSYRRVERFGKVVTSLANFRVVVRETDLWMEVIEGNDPRLGLTMTNELALAAAVTLSREVQEMPVQLSSVNLRAKAPSDCSAYAAHFQCPVRFGADRDALEIKLAAARRPNRLADRGLSDFFEAHLDRVLSEIGDPTELAHTVLSEIRRALSEGVPSLATLAGRLGMSGRTLQRRLAADGLAFQDLVARARKELAGQLLHNSDYGLAEVAFLTEFADQSAFTRAFKRWHGRTPAQFRLDHSRSA